jgi:hypothetical protein
MVNLVKIVKKVQLHLGVESRDPIIHSGFFRLKHSYTMVEEKKFHIEGFLSRKNCSIYMHVNMHVNMHVKTMHVYMHVNMHVYMHVNMHVKTAHLHACLHAC